MTLNISNITVVEGMDAEFYVTLASPSTVPVTFTPILSSDSAELGVDTASPLALQSSVDGGLTWRTVSGPVSIPPGNISIRLKIATTDDSRIEGDETFRISLSDVSVATIRDNDVPVKIWASNVNGIHSGHLTVYEKGLIANEDTSESVSGALAFTTTGGVRFIQIGETQLNLEQLSALNENNIIVPTPSGKGSLRLASYSGNGNHGTVGVVYTLLSKQSQPRENTSTDEIPLRVVSNDNRSFDDLMTVLIVDDVPSILTSNISPLDALTVDESSLEVDDTKNFTDNFNSAIAYGADGPGNVSYSVSLNGTNVNSGLLTPSKVPIFLNRSGNSIVGSSNNIDYFVISTDSNGNVTLDQKQELFYNNSLFNTLDVANSLFLRTTVTDSDGDVAIHNLDIGRGVFRFKDNPQPKLILQATTNSASIADNVTANGLPELVLNAQSNSASLITVNGVNNAPLNPATYTITESPRVDKPWLSLYTIKLVDSDITKQGIQGFGNFFLGQPTNNNANLVDGDYKVLFNRRVVNNFTIRTKKAPPSCLEDVFGKKLTAPTVITVGFLNSLNTTPFGYRRSSSIDGSGADDNLIGTSRSDTLTGKGGSDLLNGVGNFSTSPSQVDVLIGGSGKDTFQLGDISGPYYGQSQSNDYVDIKDFERGETLILHGQKELYQVRFISPTKGRPAQLSIFMGDVVNGELIAKLQGTGITAISSNPFAFLTSQVYL